MLMPAKEHTKMKVLIGIEKIKSVKKDIIMLMPNLVLSTEFLHKHKCISSTSKKTTLLSEIVLDMYSRLNLTCTAA
jgi:hypothetical protein